MRAATYLQALLALTCWGLLQAAPAGEPVNVMVEPYPPFVIEGGAVPAGPYVQAFRQLAAAQGVAVNMQLVPIRRALLTAEKTPGHCVLALNYAAETTEVLLYLGRVAPMYVWAYAKQGWSGSLTRVGDLKRYRVGAIDMAELRLLLEQQGVVYEPLQISGKGAQMLAAGRFDVLLSDIGPALETANSVAPLERRLVVLRAERWLACHPKTSPVVVAKLRLALREGLFAQSTEAIWARHGLSDYYQQVRREWPGAIKP
ncbi:hypothetical protein [Chitinimonas sp. JJ19]|uniref:hypothetical protein n=1 Tax=Chitinimonas sp. JJ19 TaxID=3109352 RepID=UPI0030028D36